MWTDQWINIPYEKQARGPTSFDCLGLWLSLMKHRFDTEILDPGCSIVYAVEAGVVDQYRGQFRKVDVAEEGDALLFFMGGHAVHLGYALNNTDMLHTLDDRFHASRIERWRGARWKGRLEGIYRLVR